MERIKLVVLNENILGYINPGLTDLVHILHASVLKGATAANFQSIIIGSGSNVRLASEQDFDNFRVSFDGYNNELEYEFEK